MNKKVSNGDKMTELFPISQPPTEEDGDANGEVFFIDTDRNKYLGRWDDASYINDSDFQHWAKTEFNPPKRPTRIVYGEPCEFRNLPSGQTFEMGAFFYDPDRRGEYMARRIGSGMSYSISPTEIVIPVTFE